MMENSQRYRLNEKVVVSNLPSSIQKLDIWIPTPLEDPQQRVEILTLKADFDFALMHDVEHGNPMLHAVLYPQIDTDITLGLEYVVERRSYPKDWLNSQISSNNKNKGLWYSYLRPERYVEVNQKTRSIALDVIAGEKDPVEQLRKLYEHVVGYMNYDAHQQSWKGSTEHALVCQVGNCNDIHSLFISLCRSINIPSRMVMGVALEEPVGGEEECDVCGYHCWAESWVQGLGWFPADASCACKYSKDQLFGDIETNHIAYSRGRDILLSPAQRGDRLLYFATPYAEVDGISHKEISRTISFKKI